MKTVFTLLIFWLSCIAFSQYTAVPDPNFEQYLEDNGMGDGIQGNGQVLTANIENVTGLQLFFLYISDFTGIEDFLNLEWLAISFSNATELDLSQNINLKALGVTYSDIQSLDLTNLTDLEELHIFITNMQTLIVGNKPNLTMIEAYSNLINSIDVSQCPLLEELIVSENQLTSLDVSHNPELRKLWCDLNWLTELDVTQNPKLFSLGLGLCAIPYLDLSQNPELEFFNIALDDAIEYIDIRNGNNEIMQTFGATQCNNLKCIYVDDPDAEYM